MTAQYAGSTYSITMERHYHLTCRICVPSLSLDGPGGLIYGTEDEAEWGAAAQRLDNELRQPGHEQAIVPCDGCKKGVEQGYCWAGRWR